LSVKIRLKRMGSKKKPFYRVVVADSRRARDGRFIEILGYYDPLKDPAEVKVDEDKVWEWMDKGARPSENVKNLLKHEGIMERWRLHTEGIAVTEMDAIIEERRKKQPAPKPKTAVKEEKPEKKEEKPEEAEEEKAASEEPSSAEKVEEETEQKPAEEKEDEGEKEKAPAEEEKKEEPAEKKEQTPAPEEKKEEGEEEAAPEEGKREDAGEEEK